MRRKTIKLIGSISLSRWTENIVKILVGSSKSFSVLVLCEYEEALDPMISIVWMVVDAIYGT